MHNGAPRLAEGLGACAVLAVTTLGGPLSSGGAEGDGEGLSLVTYWPNK